MTHSQTLASHALLQWGRQVYWDRLLIGPVVDATGVRRRIALLITLHKRELRHCEVPGINASIKQKLRTGLSRWRHF
jgi:hypothetical protein